MADESRVIRRPSKNKKIKYLGDDIFEFRRLRIKKHLGDDKIQLSPKNKNLGDDINILGDEILFRRPSFYIRRRNLSLGDDFIFVA